MFEPELIKKLDKQQDLLVILMWIISFNFVLDLALLLPL